MVTWWAVICHHECMLYPVSHLLLGENRVLKHPLLSASSTLFSYISYIFSDPYHLNSDSSISNIFRQRPFFFLSVSVSVYLFHQSITLKIMTSYPQITGLVLADSVWTLKHIKFCLTKQKFNKYIRNLKLNIIKSIKLKWQYTIKIQIHMTVRKIDICYVYTAVNWN